MLDKIFGKVRGIFNIITIIELVYSVICVLIGITFFSKPGLSNYIFSSITGCILIIYGIASILFFIKRGKIDLFNNNLIYGILLIIVGILAFFLRRTLSIVLGIYLIVVGVQRINYSILLKKYHESSWLLTLIIGIIFVIIAAITLFANDDNIVRVAGIYLIGFGFFNAINTLLLRQRSESFLA